MCWNASVSLNTFLLSAFAIGLAVLNKIIVPIKAFYYLLFVSMQLVEYFTWKHMNDQNRNQLLSKIGYVIILSLPIANILAFSLKKLSFVLPMLLFYIVFVLIVLFSYKTDYSMTRASNGHLAWNWLKFPQWVVMIYFLFWLSPYLFRQNWLLVAIHSSLFILVYYTYLQTDTWGSMWCWISNFFSLYLLVAVFKKDFCSS